MGAPVVFVCVFAVFGTILAALELHETCCDPYRYEEYDIAS